MFTYKYKLLILPIYVLYQATLKAKIDGDEVSTVVSTSDLSITQGKVRVWYLLIRGISLVLVDQRY